LRAIVTSIVFLGLGILIAGQTGDASSRQPIPVQAPDRCASHLELREPPSGADTFISHIDRSEGGFAVPLALLVVVVVCPKPATIPEASGADLTDLRCGVSPTSSQPGACTIEPAPTRSACVPTPATPPPLEAAPAPDGSAQRGWP